MTTGAGPGMEGRRVGSKCQGGKSPEVLCVPYCTQEGETGSRGGRMADVQGEALVRVKGVTTSGFRICLGLSGDLMEV